ncbi:MAG TPA: hypothetical protein PK840_05590 [Bacilli bacterium]|nr:hypothetical protein [Bacilli bacterium]
MENKFIEGDRFEVTVSETKIKLVALTVTNHFVVFRILGTWESPKSKKRKDPNEGEFVWIDYSGHSFRVKAKDKINKR